MGCVLGLLSEYVGGPFDWKFCMIGFPNAETVGRETFIVVKFPRGMIPSGWTVPWKNELLFVLPFSLELFLACTANGL